MIPKPCSLIDDLGFPLPILPLSEKERYSPEIGTSDIPISVFFDKSPHLSLSILCKNFAAPPQRFLACLSLEIVLGERKTPFFVSPFSILSKTYCTFDLPAIDPDGRTRKEFNPFSISFLICSNVISLMEDKLFSTINNACAYLI